MTVFNHPDSLKRKPLLKEALFGNEENSHRLLRFMGNNDMPHFIGDHTVDQTKMVAAMIFSLPGIPMLYNGQEIGKTGHPYEIDSVFERGKSINEMDNKGLFEYYQNLITLRKKYPALTGESFEEIPVTSEEGIISFRRWKDDQSFVVVLNLFGNDKEFTINLEDLLMDENKVRDVLSEERFDIDDSGSANIPMEGYSARWLIFEN